MKTTNAYLLSFSGVDGTGKTTIFNWLKEKYKSDNRVVFIDRGPSYTEALVEKYYPRINQNKKDWIETDFGNAIAIACSMDYLSYFNARIKKYIFKKKIIVMDRSSFCFKALASCLNKKEEIAMQMLEKLPPLNHVFFITSSWDNISKRISDSNYEFESLYCQKKFLKGYELMIDSDNYLELTRFLNDSSLEIIKEQVGKKFESVYHLFFNNS